LRDRLNEEFKLPKDTQRIAEFSGVAGEFRCLSLHRSQISQDL